VSVVVGNAGSAAFAAGQRVRLGRVTDPRTGRVSYVFDDLVRDVPLGVNRPGFGAASCLAKDADHGEEVPG
jgi:hypothetical protein